MHGQEPEFHIFIPKGLSHSPKAAPPPHTDLQAPRTCLDQVATAKLNLDSDFQGRPRVKSVKSTNRITQPTEASVGICRRHSVGGYVYRMTVPLLAMEKRRTTAGPCYVFS